MQRDPRAASPMYMRACCVTLSTRCNRTPPLAADTIARWAPLRGVRAQAQGGGADEDKDKQQPSEKLYQDLSSSSKPDWAAWGTPLNPRGMCMCMHAASSERSRRHASYPRVHPPLAVPGFMQGINWYCYIVCGLLLITDLTPVGKSSKTSAHLSCTLPALV